MSAFWTIRDRPLEKQSILDSIIICHWEEHSEKDAEKGAEELEILRTENAAMYAALLEASQFGTNSAALRCKVELQRIARNNNAEVVK